MTIFKRYKIKSYEMGLYFREGEFRGLLEQGTHWFVDPLLKVRVDVVSQREPWLVHDKLDLIVKSGQLGQRATVIDLKDHERALVWIEERFSHILGPGLYAYWTGQKKVRVEVVDARAGAVPGTRAVQGHRAARKRWRSGSLDDVCTGAARPRRSAVHRRSLRRDARSGRVRLLEGTGRRRANGRGRPAALETIVDVGGQEIMTADKVTLRLNAVVTYKVVDARKAVSQTDDVRQALYRDTQLVLRGVIGARELDLFLTDKDAVAKDIEENVRRRAEELGLEIASVGIKDVILPGDMKDLMNKVTEARKAAEANLIARREETAAIRSQANTAKLLADSPTLMRLRELEVLEKVAAAGKLNIIVGEKGLAERVVNLI